MKAFSKEIPLFPLNIFLLPGDYTQLYIFEERYKQLISDCIENNLNFGIAYSNSSNNKNYGCMVEVSEIVNKYPDGEMDILVRAVSLFQLEKFFFQKEGKLYPGGRISELPLVQNHKAGAELLTALRHYLVQNKDYDPELLVQDNIGMFDIASEIRMNDSEKLVLINLKEPEEMDKYLRNYLRYLELLLVQEKSTYKNFYLN